MRNNHIFLSLFILLPTVFFQFGCSGGLGSQASLATNFSAEVALCNKEISYPTGVILTGTAKFYKRGTEMVTTIVSSQLQLSNMVLGDPIANALPIQNAEVAVYDQNLKLVQCGSTDSSGALKSLNTTSDLYLPSIAQNYRVRVLARSNYQYTSDPNDFISVSIKKDTYKNEVHFIENFVYSDGASGANLDLVALARQESYDMEITGGAFNILNNIQQSYDYIKNHTTAGTTNCLSTKFDVFWKAGFNPMQYQNPQADPNTLANTSFYLSSTNQLFISGGQLGDISLSNTDHFDDFATVHELGHFVEKNCGQFTSPGGSHAFLSRIDQRLAWSEGWANYFATHVLNSQMSNIDPTMNSKLVAVNETQGWTFFFNSSGFSDSVQNVGNGSGFMIDFKKAGTNPGAYVSGSHTGTSYDIVNPALYKGEGHTREGAITRGLYKLTHDCGSFCISTAEIIPFTEIWQSFDRNTGFAQPGITTPFVGSYNFLTQLKTIHTSWNSSHDNTIAAEALHIADSDFTASGRLLWTGYGKRLASGACNLTIEPHFDDPSLTGTTSDQRYSSHNYTVDLNTLPVGTSSLSVAFTKSAGTDLDHDLLLFKAGFEFNDDYRCTKENASGVCTGTWAPIRTINSDVLRSDRHAVSALSTTYTKTISSLDLLSVTEMYLLNIRSYTAGKSVSTNTKYDYVITANPSGAIVCPTP